MMREDWVEVELGKALKTTSGGTPSRRKPEYYIGSIPWVKSGELNYNTILETDEYISEEAVKNSSAKIFPKGTLLIALYGATIGKLAFLGVGAATNQAVCGIFQNEVLESRFLYYYLFHNRRKLIEQGAGGAQPNISQTILKILPVVVAPLPEQRAIVARIEQFFSELDNGIASLKSARAKLEIYRQAVLKKAFEGELTKEWREKQTDVQPSIEALDSIARNRKKRYLEGKRVGVKKLKKDYDFEFTPVEEPSSWAKGKLDKLIYIAARIGWRGLKKDEYTKEGPLFLSVYSLNHGKFVDFREAFHISEERYIESPEIQLQEGDILLCKDGAGIGKIGIIKDLPSEATVNSSLLVIRSLEVFIQEFLYYLFSGPNLQRIVFERITGSATPHLFQNDIRKFELLIPPIQEQKQIVQEIESRLSVCDKLAESIDQSLEKAEALRQSILKKAFSGKLLTEIELEACRQKPDWEPAESLLDRIKKEKTK